MRNRGFTLVEFVFGMAAGVAIAMVAVFLYAPVRNWDFMRDRRGGLAADTAAVSKIMREIGRIQNPTMITTMTATTLIFTDVDGNIVTFSLSSGNILRGSDILVGNVTSLTFTYMDGTGTVTATAANVRMIKVNITLTYGQQTIRLESTERLRNFT